eukprot:Seg951.4 transcript_id=Seg951.4/GoldUCD/mRNA.D3Y31 product="hypothetical protein" protein_id=Seg951.4/GoldUCD/D3Y31
MRRKKPPPLVIPHSNFGDISKETNSPAKVRKASVVQIKQGLAKRRTSEVKNRKKSTKDVKFHADTKIRRKSRSKSFRNQENENDAKKQGSENKLQAKSESVDNKQQSMAATTSPLADRNSTKNAGKQTVKKGVHFSSAAKQEGQVDTVRKTEEGRLRNGAIGGAKENKRISETQKSVDGLKLLLDDSGSQGLLPSADTAEPKGQRQRDRKTEKDKLVKHPTKDSTREPRADKKQGLLEDDDKEDVCEKAIVPTSKKASIIAGKRRASERVGTKELSSKLHSSKLNNEEASSKSEEASAKEGVTKEMKMEASKDNKRVNCKRKDKRQILETTEEEEDTEVCDETHEVKDKHGKATNDKAKVLKNKGLANKQTKERFDKTMHLNSPMLSPKIKGEYSGLGNEVTPNSPKGGLSLTNAGAAIGVDRIPEDTTGVTATFDWNFENKGSAHKALLKRKRGSVPKVSELADLRSNLGVINQKVKVAEEREKEIVIYKKNGNENIGADLNGKEKFSKEKVKSNGKGNIAAGKNATDHAGNMKSELPLKQDGGKCDLYELTGKQKIRKEFGSEKDRSKLTGSFDFVEGKVPIPMKNSTDKPHTEEKENFTKEHARKIFGKKELHRLFKKEASKTTLESFKEEEESPNEIDKTKGRKDYKTEGSIEQTMTEGHTEGPKEIRKNKLAKLKSKSSSIDSQKRGKRSLSQSTDEPSPGITEVKTEDVFQELNRRRASVVEIDAQRRFRKLSNMLQTPLISPKNKLIFDFSVDAKKQNRTRKQSILSQFTDQRSMSPRSKRIFSFNTDNTIAFRYSEMPFFCVVDSKCCYRSKTKQEQVKHHVTHHSSQTPFFCISCLTFGSKVAFETRLGLTSHEKELKHNEQLPVISSALIS